MGDGIQAAKAGILEIGDVYVVNKADRDGARTVRRDLRSMLSLTERPEGSWRPPVLLTTAHTGAGVAELVEQLGAHLAWAAGSGALRRRRLRRARAEVEAIALTALRRRWAGVSEDGDLDELAELVVGGETDPYSAADRLVGRH
jgi:LAO/AO transport system kinase